MIVVIGLLIARQTVYIRIMRANDIASTDGDPSQMLSTCSISVKMGIAIAAKRYRMHLLLMPNITSSVCVSFAA